MARRRRAAPLRLDRHPEGGKRERLDGGLPPPRQRGRKSSWDSEAGLAASVAAMDLAPSFDPCSVDVFLMGMASPALVLVGIGERRCHRQRQNCNCDRFHFDISCVCPPWQAGFNVFNVGLYIAKSPPVQPFWPAACCRRLRLGVGDLRDFSLPQFAVSWQAASPSRRRSGAASRPSGAADCGGVRVGESTEMARRHRAVPLKLDRHPEGVKLERLDGGLPPPHARGRKVSRPLSKAG